MSNRTCRLVPLGSLILALGGWGCGQDEPATGPSAAPLDATASAVTYVVQDLGTLGGSSSHAYGINSAGVVVGASGVAGPINPRGFVWRNGTMSPLSALAGGASEALAINDDGVIVGASTTAGGARRAVRWQNGTIRSLGTLGGRNSEARAINEYGVIVGWSETASGQRHAFIWKNGVMTDIGTLGGATSGANGINRSGTVVGQSTTASGQRHAFRWKDGVFKDLGAMGRQYSFASAINTKGQIVGAIGPTEDAVGEELDFASPFLYYQEVMSRPPTTSQRVTTFPRAISPTGIVVGQGFDTGDEPRDETAWWLENGVGGVLPTLDPAIGLDNHAGAEGVNRAGTIVGFSKAPNGQYHAVLWRRQ
jgi:probable HAF family extracellular repeat protein